MRYFNAGCVILLVLFAGTLARADERPNIVLIMCDDMGWSDIGCYGGEVDTPHLNRLASQGLRFTQFYNAGRCCPTRACLLTGLYPHQAAAESWRDRIHRAVHDRLGDVDPAGALRFDAVARYLQDVATDDAADAELSPTAGWLVRRSLVVVERPAALGEELRAFRPRRSAGGGGSPRRR